MKKEDKKVEVELVVGILFKGDIKDFWKIKMPCGEEVSYRLNEFPEVDTPCPCGNKKHWIARFEE